jgi:hypothetical protein
MGAKIISINGAQPAPKAQQSRMETVILNVDMVNQWVVPGFQRPVRITDKVREAVEQIKRDESIEGVLTLGRLKESKELYIVDGQHRAEAFRLAGIEQAIADVRVMTFDSFAEMADEYVKLNSSLVKMRPDDLMRGLESSLPALQAIRKSCEFVGYDQIRRGTSSPIVSMSALIRCWTGSGTETPTSTAGGQSATVMAHNLDPMSVQHLIAFLNVAHAAWGRDPEYYRLWGNLNLILCMWMWNKMVIDRDRSGSKRYAVLTIPEFKSCLMSVSAETDYLSWLPGRQMGDRDRSPAYVRLKSIFARRLGPRDGKKLNFPSPAWSVR